MTIDAERVTTETQAVEPRIGELWASNRDLTDSAWANIIVGAPGAQSTAAPTSPQPRSQPQGFAFLAPPSFHSPLARAVWMPALGVLSLFLAFLPSIQASLLAFVVGIVAIVFGYRAVGSNPSGLSIGRHAPTAAVVAGGAGIIVSMIVLVFLFVGLVG